jgi:hypothetical protein
MTDKVLIAAETRHQGRARMQAQHAARALASGHRVLLWSQGEFVRVLAAVAPLQHPARKARPCR